jgi:putrescine transport system ATP-binding protein
VSTLELRALQKSFDQTHVIHGVDLQVAHGEFVVFVGPSGCGKSTLLRMLAGFEAPTSGQIVLGGQDIVGLAPYDRPINMMFQSYALFPHLNVWDNIAFGLRRDGMAKPDITQRVDEMLEMVQLKPYAKRKPHQLSGGQQQRVALARSLAKRPRLLLLDEPLGALDAKLRQRTQLELVHIIQRVGVTCVMVTHDQEEAMTMATRIGVMSEGKILQIGRPEEIYETPNCRFVADFIGTVNLFKGRVSVDEPDHVVIDSPECSHYVSHGITGTLGMEVDVAVRPEKMVLQTTEPTALERQADAEAGSNQVQGVITDIAYLGSLTTYHVRMASGLVLKVTQTNAARHTSVPLASGDAVWVWWGGSDIVVLTR